MMRTILIVDDSETCAETLQIALETLPNLAIMVVQSPREALAALRNLRDANNDIAALITDLNLPRQDGFELIREFRSDPRYAAVPVLLISGDTDPLLPRRARDHGVDAFFPKPYSPAAVRRKLEQLLC